MTPEQKAKFARDGFLKLPNHINRTQLMDLREKAEWMFQCASPVHDRPFPSMQHLFKHEHEKFKHVGKAVQHMVELWRLATSDMLLNLVQELGVTIPNICTRPVLFFNHPSLATDPIYNSVPAHQDWGSMQGSLNSVVVWIPLMNIDIKHGAIKVEPGSHKRGLLPRLGNTPFHCVEAGEMMSVPCAIGDVVVFNSFLVHQSGNNLSDEPRWSCHFRYNDLAEDTYRRRGFPVPYDYYPWQKLITENFP